MKILRHAFVFAASFALILSGPSVAAEAEAKGKEKPAESSKKPKAAKKEVKKSKGKEDAGKTDSESDDLKRANEILAALTPAKQTALAKLLNTGTKEDLLALPRIGATTADAIIKARPLESAAHLVTVKGVGEKTLSEIVKSRK